MTTRTFILAVAAAGLAFGAVGRSCAETEESGPSARYDAAGKKLERFRNLPSDPARAKQNVQALLSLGRTAPSELSEPVLEAACAGMIALGDNQGYTEQRGNLCRVNGFEEEILDVCRDCEGTGRANVACSTCHGSGRCPIPNCNNGRRFVPKLGVVSCATCRGAGRCPDCGGNGKVQRRCGRCNGSPKRINRDKARHLYEDRIAAAIDVCRNQVEGARRIEEEKNLDRDQFEEPRIVTIEAKNAEGVPIGSFRKGDRIRFRYLDGTWTAWEATWKRGSPDAGDTPRAILFSQGWGNIKEELPSETKTTPFVFTIPKDGTYAIRINDGDHSEHYNDNAGQVRYSVARKRDKELEEKRRLAEEKKREEEEFAKFQRERGLVLKGGKWMTPGSVRNIPLSVMQKLLNEGITTGRAPMDFEHGGLLCLDAKNNVVCVIVSEEEWHLADEGRTYRFDIYRCGIYSYTARSGQEMMVPLFATDLETALEEMESGEYSERFN